MFFLHAGCESYQELKDSFTLVFKAVAKEEVRPQIHVRNTTQVFLGEQRLIVKCIKYYPMEAIV